MKRSTWVVIAAVSAAAVFMASWFPGVGMLALGILTEHIGDPFVLSVIALILAASAGVVAFVDRAGKKRGRSDRLWWFSASGYSLAAAFVSPFMLMFIAAALPEAGRWLCVYLGPVVFAVFLVSSVPLLIIGLFKTKRP